MLCDWQIQVCMLDYDDDKEKGKEVLERLLDKLDSRFGVYDASFSLTDCGIISDIFEAKIQSDLKEYWDDFFAEGHSFFVTAINTQLETPLTWEIENGKSSFDNSTCFIDAWGNRCELDTSRVIVYGTKASKEDIYALPVKKMIETGEGWSDGGQIFKVPSYFENHYDEEDLETDEFSDYLHCPAGGTYGEDGGYLLDKNGNHITTLCDFDHSETDADGNVFYFVPASDLEDGSGDNPLTPEAVEKWKAKLGL